jgi:glutamate-1-semialdehyde 2,1-aminomutase
VTGAASLFRIHPTSRRPNDYRDTHSGLAGVALMKEMTRFFTDNGIILPLGAAASLSTPTLSSSLTCSPVSSMRVEMV